MKGLVLAAVSCLMAVVSLAAEPVKVDPSKDPYYMFVLVSCGKADMVVVVTKDGVGHPAVNVPIDAVKELAHELTVAYGKGHAGYVDLGCAKGTAV